MVLAVPAPRRAMPLWRNRLAHGTYRQCTLLSHAGVVSSSLTRGSNFGVSLPVLEEHCGEGPPTPRVDHEFSALSTDLIVVVCVCLGVRMYLSFPVLTITSN